MKSKLNWSKQEENMLKQLGSKVCKRKWVDIAKQINKLCPQKQRTSKQCREKYINHVQYECKENNNNWTKEQEHFLFSQYLLKGSKWKIISAALDSKSENSVKNKFYGKIRKLVRKLNNVCRQRINRSNKPLKDQSVMRIIDIDQGFQNMPEFLVNESFEIKKELLNLAEMGLENFENWGLIQQNNVVNLIKKIHKFNINSRYFCSKKKKSAIKRKENHSPSEEQKVQGNIPTNQTQCFLKIEDIQTPKLLQGVSINLPNNEIISQ